MSTFNSCSLGYVTTTPARSFCRKFLITNAGDNLYNDLMPMSEHLEFTSKWSQFGFYNRLCCTFASLNEKCVVRAINFSSLKNVVSPVPVHQFSESAASIISNHKPSNIPLSVTTQPQCSVASSTTLWFSETILLFITNCRRKLRLKVNPIPFWSLHFIKWSHFAFSVPFQSV